jgi:hypothetical protein
MGTPNAANPAMGTSQAPSPPGMGGEADVACAIHCCDKKEYNLPKKKGKKAQKTTCQRLGSRKHSCVLHKLREKTESGKLTTTNKFKNVLASPRCSAPGVGRTLIPDTIVDGVAIDAKFPCDPSKVKFGSPVKNLSLPRPGTSMQGDKELNEYKAITKPVKVQDCQAMTPSDAAEAKGSNCKC